MRDLFLEAPFRSGSNNFKLGSKPSPSERSRRYPDEQMVPQNNYALKHNILPKSSSWRGAHWLLAYGKYEWPPYYSSKPKTNEEWRFENSHCGGRAVLTTASNKVCPSSRFLWTTYEKLKPCNSNPEIANAEAPQTTSTSSPSTCASFPASSSISPWSPKTKSCSRTPSELSLRFSTKTFSSGTHGGWWKSQNDFWQNLHLTQYLLEMKWSLHAGWHFSQTFHGIARLDYQLLHLKALLIFYVLITMLMNLSASNDVRMKFQGTVERN